MFKGRKQRVRLHLIEDHLPTVEGLMISRRPEYLIAVPKLITTTEGQALSFTDARLLAVPRDRVAFYEVL